MAAGLARADRGSGGFGDHGLVVATGNAAAAGAGDGREEPERGDFAGAWEGLEVTFGRYPDDQKLGQLRADLTTQSPDFVREIRQAKALEERKDYGSSLAWYLRSQNRYPMSDLSKQGIQRVVKQILPDTN